MGIRKILLVILFVCLTTRADAARGFGSTFGVGSTDLILSGFSTTFPQNISLSYWVWINGTGGGGLARIWVQGLAAMQFASPSLLGFFYGFSTTGGSWTIATPSNSAWHHIVVTYNNNATSNFPVIYIDGVSVTVTISTTPVGTAAPTSGVFQIGNRNPTPTRNWDGKIAEFAYWSNTILTANEVASLANGVSPLQIRPSALAIYLPLYGLQANEQDWASNGVQTLTGTKFQPHPPIDAYPLQWVTGR